MLLPITKKELAFMYSPGLTYKGAINRLNRWIHTDPQLMKELYATGYRRTQKVLTSRQRHIIQEYLE